MSGSRRVTSVDVLARISAGFDIPMASRLTLFMGTETTTAVLPPTQTHRAVALRPHIEAAFNRPKVSIDFAGFAGETLRDAMAEVLDKVRAGLLAPETIAIRMLLSDMTVPMALPADANTRLDDPEVRARMDRIMRRAVDGLIDQVHELGELGLIQASTISVRVHSAAPLVKLYVLNGEEAFFGFYNAAEHTVSIKHESRPILDPMGKDVSLFHYSAKKDRISSGTDFVEASRRWFESIWTTIAREYQA